jgi:hypothetical protein
VASPQAGVTKQFHSNTGSAQKDYATVCVGLLSKIPEIRTCTLRCLAKSPKSAHVHWVVGKCDNLEMAAATVKKIYHGDLYCFPLSNTGI